MPHHTAEEIRHLAIELLTAPTARDEQTSVGASNLSNQCDYCLVSELSGISRETVSTDRPWGGRVFGTAMHGLLEERARSLPWFRQRYPEAGIEGGVTIGTLGSYGVIPGHYDLFIGDLIDWKRTTRKKAALLRDFLLSQGIGRAGQEPYFQKGPRSGYKYKLDSDTTVQLSERDYAAQMVKQAYKVTGYYGQANLYLRALRAEGKDVDTAFLVFVNGDGNGWFDNPALEDYQNEKRMQDVWVLEFAYNEAWADQLWDRALSLHQAILAGVPRDSFPSHEQCYPCSQDRREWFAAQALIAEAEAITATEADAEHAVA